MGIQNFSVSAPHTFDVLCENDGFLNVGLTVAGSLIQNLGPDGTPGDRAFSVACSQCGAVESFNTALRLADETDTGYHRRSQQARIIRAILLILAWQRNNTA